LVVICGQVGIKGIHIRPPISSETSRGLVIGGGVEIVSLSSMVEDCKEQERRPGGEAKYFL
jgi:hypothetical protein